MSDVAEGDGAVPRAEPLYACDVCLRRSWLIGRLGGHLEHHRSRIASMLALDTPELLAAVGGGSAVRCRHELERLDLAVWRAEQASRGIETICRCHPDYPPRLRDLQTPPAVLHVAGGLADALSLLRGRVVAVVGARQATAYGVEVARALGRELAGAEITVVSGMALGVDAAAHRGVLEEARSGATVAVLPASPARAYPASQRRLHRMIVSAGAAVSELAWPGSVWRWMFPARNRVIAALAEVTVVVEARERSGSLVTAAVATQLSRTVGAVPGRVTSPQARGTNGLLAEGARLIRNAGDVLEALGGAASHPVLQRTRPPLRPELEALLARLDEGAPGPVALTDAGLSVPDGLAALAELELAGYVRRGAGGSYVVIP